MMMVRGGAGGGARGVIRRRAFASLTPPRAMPGGPEVRGQPLALACGELGYPLAKPLVLATEAWIYSS